MEHSEYALDDPQRAWNSLHMEYNVTVVQLVRVEPCIISGLACTNKWICYSFLDNLVISIYSFYTNNIYL